MTLAVDTDFADLFAVKEGRVQPPHGLAADIGTASMAFTLAGPDDTRSAQITATGDPIVTPGRFTFRIVVPERSQWSTCFAVEASIGGRRIQLRHRCGEPIDVSAPAQRLSGMATLQSPDRDRRFGLRFVRSRQGPATWARCRSKTRHSPAVRSLPPALRGLWRCSDEIPY